MTRLRAGLRDLSFSTGEILLPRSIKTKGPMGALRRAASHWARDAFVLSYPKAGRTWFRTMIGYIISRQYNLALDNPMEIQHFWKLSSRIPNIGFTHDDSPNLKFGAEVETDKSRYAAKRILFLTRDPRDVLVSYYFDAKNRMKVIDCSIGRYLREERGSIDAIVAFYNAWAQARSRVRAFHWITYEDMHVAPRRVLREACSFLQIPEPDDALLDQAVEFASFENLRKIEMSDGFKHERLRPADPANPESYKVRRGKAGGYVDYLSEDEIAFVDEYIARHLDPFFDIYQRPSVRDRVKSEPGLVG
ncbi:sulfotransferase domain-containing protein [Stakelama saccharophila]|uniref:Sulfotransferase domain-containing protein n=1 Tax=Stakelama saccharophila TaxID=3075605 RepID=A0ABZ0BA14_9SPHN|nr:sulfotransferase domain-containing protein [Stakelama sp. W311]WNO54224.1 sulfotransferase domain-containing protein [Stakelama sp. W311]